MSNLPQVLVFTTILITLSKHQNFTDHLQIDNLRDKIDFEHTFYFSLIFRLVETYYEDNENIWFVRCRHRITEFFHQKRFLHDLPMLWWWNTRNFLNGARHCFISPFVEKIKLFGSHTKACLFNHVYHQYNFCSRRCVIKWSVNRGKHPVKNP